MRGFDGMDNRQVSDMDTNEKISHGTKRFRGGIILILVAIAIVLISVFGGSKINVFTSIASILLLLMAINCALHRLFTGVFFPIAFIYIINYNSFRIAGLTPGVVFLVALLLSIGMGLLIKPEWNRKCKPGNHIHDDMREHDFGSAMEDDSSRAYCNTYFDGKSLRCTSKDFKELEIHCRFSGQMVSLKDVIVPNGSCQIVVDASYSGLELHIPSNWVVIDSTTKSMAGFHDKGSNPADGPVTMTILGNLRLSGISIVRV